MGLESRGKEKAKGEGEGTWTDCWGRKKNEGSFRIRVRVQSEQ